MFAASGEVERAKASVGPVVAACERAVGGVLEDVEFNAKNGEQIGHRIGEERSRSRLVAILLDSVSMALICSPGAPTSSSTSQAAWRTT